MFMNKESKVPIGWRTIKTAISVMIVIAIFEFTHRGTPMLGALAAIFALRDSHNNSLKFAYVRIIGNTVGAILASLLIQIGFSINILNASWFQILAGALGILLVIQTCNIIGRSESIISSSATFLVVFYNTPINNIAHYGSNRVLDTIIGSVIAVLVNSLLPGGQLYNSIKNNESRQ